MPAAKARMSSVLRSRVLSPRKFLFTFCICGAAATLYLISYFEPEFTTDRSGHDDAEEETEPKLVSILDFVQDSGTNTSTAARDKLREVRISPLRAIGNIDCKLDAGSGEAQGLAVIALPTGNELDFAVLDESGTRFSGSLPFFANKTRLGKRSDGSILVGFGDLRLNSRVFKPRDFAEPIRIYHNNHVIFESEKVWDFDVARDGSSFAVQEPAPGGASRLIIRNLNSGKESHYDLGTAFTPKNEYESSYALRYSMNYEEVMFEPAHADAMGRGSHWFYPLGEGIPRRITVKFGKAAVFSDSTNWYFVDYSSSPSDDDRGKQWKIYRKKLNPTLNEEKTLWETTIELDYFYGNIVLSQNGKWLALSSWNYTVLNTTNGETKLQFPVNGDNKIQLQRLGHLLPSNAKVSDIGAFVGSSFSGDNLLFSRRVGNAKACSNRSGETFDFRSYLTCLRELRLKGEYRVFQDVFDMNEVSKHGRPIYRVEAYRDSPCSTIISPSHQLRVQDGEIRYGLFVNDEDLN